MQHSADRSRPGQRHGSVCRALGARLAARLTVRLALLSGSALIALIAGIALTPPARAEGEPPRWSAAGQPTGAARSLLEELTHAERRGLDPTDYAPERLAARMAALPSGGADAAAAFDRALGQVTARFVSDLHFGRIDPAAVGHHLDVDREALDVPGTLAALAAAPAAAPLLDALEPQFEHYALLERQLVRYRELARDPSLTLLPAPPRSVHPRESYPGAPALARLLAALGDLPPQDAQSVPRMLTPALSAALARFQQRHGQAGDGVLGRATYEELSRPLSARVRQIELTLERWRWMPRALNGPPIIVNIPQFRLFALASARDIESGMRQMNVIVGKAFEATQTPVFSADMTYLVFRPYWEVPVAITRHEILPAARREPDYLERHQMEIVEGYGPHPALLAPTLANLELAARGAARVRQRPGPDNALGLVKFMMPNRYDVYLHSTPAKALFGQSRRAFSHGCVRVSDPVGLAEYVLRDDPSWTAERILAAMNDTETLEVHLPHPIRVLIVYGTALAMEPGNILFFDDLYGHDRRLEQALAAHHTAVLAALAGTGL